MHLFPGWDRPFGFIANNSNQLAIEDLIKLAKADWNFFSNYMYGVPFQNCVTASEIFGDEVLKIIDDKVIINNKQFIEAEISNIKVVSGYQSASEKLLNNDKLFSPIWRKVFGIHPPISDYLKSFITTNMKMKFYIRFEKSFDPDLEEICYNTYIYGGSINLDYPNSTTNERFLDSQLQGIKQSIEKVHFRKIKAHINNWKNFQNTK